MSAFRVVAGDAFEPTVPGTWGRVGTWWDYSGTIDGVRAGILLAAADAWSPGAAGRAVGAALEAWKPYPPAFAPARRDRDE